MVKVDFATVKNPTPSGLLGSSCTLRPYRTLGEMHTHKRGRSRAGKVRAEEVIMENLMGEVRVIATPDA